MTPGRAVEVTGLGLVLPDSRNPRTGLSPVLPPRPGWFQTARELPGRGYKRLPAGCQYLLAAANAAIDDAGDCLGSDPDRRGLVVGFNNIGAALLDSMDRTIIEADSMELPPLTTPFMATSVFAGRVAAEHQLTGFSLTANSPATAGLEALGLSARAMAAGRADVILVGTGEDAPPEHWTQTAADVGAVMLVCERAGAAAARGGVPYGTCEVYGAYLDPQDPAAMPQVLDELWDSAIGGRKLSHTEGVFDGSATGAAASAWLERRAPRYAMAPRPPNAGCLEPARYVVGLLAARDPEPSCHAVVANSAQGNVALAVVTRFGRGGSGVSRASP